MHKFRWTIDPSHRLRGARQVPSPNQDERPAPRELDLIVIHAISLPPGRYGGDHIDRLFTNRLDPAAHPYFQTVASLRVSAHCCIFRDGSVTQYVAFDRRAWHAGVSNWHGRERCNDFSIGIELEGVDSAGFESAQYVALAGVARALIERYPGLSEEAIAGHSDLAPGRKTDPGPGFDWAQFRSLLTGMSAEAGA